MKNEDFVSLQGKNPALMSEIATIKLFIDKTKTNILSYIFILRLKSDA